MTDASFKKLWSEIAFIYCQFFHRRYLELKNSSTHIFYLWPILALLKMLKILKRWDTLAGTTLRIASSLSNSKSTTMHKNDKELEQLWQRAEVSMHFLAEIRRRDFQEPLVERLMRLRVPGLEATTEQMKELFTKGVELDYSVFDQKRISQGKNQNIERGDDLFTFYPTTLATQPIFEKMMKMEQHTRSVFIHGPYGIAKTTSIVLHHYLSAQVNAYLYHLPTREAVREYQQKWLAEGNPVPKKMFYWSIKQNQTYDQLIKIMRRQCDFPELIPENKDSVTQPLNLKLQQAQQKAIIESKLLFLLAEKIQQVYEAKEIRCDIVFDQIDAVARAYRDYNTHMNTKDSAEKAQNASSIRKIKTAYEQASISLQYHESLQKIGEKGTIYYNSASEVEAQLLGRRKGNLQTLQINDHTDAQQMPIDYCRSLAHTAGQQEIDIIIAKEILKRLPAGFVRQLYPEVESGADEQKILELVRGMKKPDERWNFYVRPLSIVSGFDKIGLQVDTGAEDFQQSVGAVMERIGESSFKEMLKKYKSFLGQQPFARQRSVLASLIYLLVKERLEISNEIDRVMEQIKRTEKEIKQGISRLHLQLKVRQIQGELSTLVEQIQGLDQKSLLEKYYSVELPPAGSSDPQSQRLASIKLRLQHLASAIARFTETDIEKLFPTYGAYLSMDNIISSQLFVHDTRKKAVVLQPSLAQYCRIFQSDTNLSKISMDVAIGALGSYFYKGGLLGLLVEESFIKSLQDNTPATVIRSNQTIKLKASRPFPHLSGKVTSEDVHRVFEGLFLGAQKIKNDQFLFCAPVKKPNPKTRGAQMDEPSSNSPSIDFMFVGQGYKKLTIKSFDFTVLKTKQDIIKKFQTDIIVDICHKLGQQIKKKRGRFVDFSWEHYVVVRPHLKQQISSRTVNQCKNRAIQLWKKKNQKQGKTSSKNPTIQENQSIQQNQVSQKLTYRLIGFDELKVIQIGENGFPHQQLYQSIASKMKAGSGTRS